MRVGQDGPPQPIFEPHLFGGGSHVPLIAPWLQPHERLLGIVDVKLSDLIPRVLPREVRPGEQWTGILGAVQGVAEAAASAVDAVQFLGFGIIRRPRRALRGAGLTGGWQSMAGQFAIAARTGPHTWNTLSRGVVPPPRH